MKSGTYDLAQGWMALSGGPKTGWMAQSGALDGSESLKVKSSVAQTGNLTLPGVCATEPSWAGFLQRAVVGNVYQVIRFDPEHLDEAGDALGRYQPELQSFALDLSLGHFRQHGVGGFAYIPPSLKVLGQELRPFARTLWRQILGGLRGRSGGFQMLPFCDRPSPLKALKPNYPTSPVRQGAQSQKISLSDALGAVFASGHTHA